MKFLHRHKILLLIIVALVFLYLIFRPNPLAKESRVPAQSQTENEIQLPNPLSASSTSIEEALRKRRSTREYKNQAITLQQVAQLLWAAQGVTSNQGFRTAPSAGALYPLEVYLIAKNVTTLSTGIYHYVPAKHRLQKLKDGDFSLQLAKAALGQNAVEAGAANLVITAVFSKMTAKYGDAGIRFALMEAGHAAQNIYLQTVSLNLATVSIGSFDTTQLKQILPVTHEEPLYILPIGGKETKAGNHSI
ncbi:SagB/ThcOx family dehydrogenase [Fluoribacter dumoffii]|uniref:SagB-type dehydrogenase domain n=1 Tax=Fluoribacter dumoffii TaxID=463 RepID=A0A377GEY1_9GAMM|nr:SagB/ThcOx family dehydrogenase [Fluoribacter dumoffii]KTC91202.1 putative nitroreductase [Fluoribacter dumoffii NY 23]MCW8387630.1 SagB/ThcOx family dehydrogenase [Fluoribacter dumoffii]MCW8416824.1 SagB/ThcOx family dehydrogenase [Fluoribacter dumoffii]MCW8455336.1 SagB/ThcOx family dehydrogenase [Fluoribacter dumoffii]MCW8460586.1 SagB/ThcOx family dehydrogenase [Fluoribacter dumoffii]